MGMGSSTSLYDVDLCKRLELEEFLRNVGSTPTLCTVSLHGIKKSLEVML
jgi:hypothetical protein